MRQSRECTIRRAGLCGLIVGALAFTAVPPARAQQTVAPPINPTVIPPVSPSIPVSPATPVTPLAHGGLTPAPIVPPEQVAPPMPLAGSGGNPAITGGAATPLSGPPVDPLPGHAGQVGKP